MLAHLVWTDFGHTAGNVKWFEKKNFIWTIWWIDTNAECQYKSLSKLIIPSRKKRRIEKIILRITNWTFFEVKIIFRITRFFISVLFSVPAPNKWAFETILIKTENLRFYHLQCYLAPNLRNVEIENPRVHFAGQEQCKRLCIWFKM